VVLTISEAAESKRISRNAVWLAIMRGKLTARKTSGGIWLIDEDGAWGQYHPRNYRRRHATREGKRGDSND